MLGACAHPSIDALARSIADIDLPQPLLVDVARQAVAAGDPDSARARAEAVARTLLQPVINATGVLLHTNLGRAPLAWHQEPGYSNLELDLATGRRGSRHAHAATLLARACNAEAAMVVNNGASAVLLVLAALARGRGVVVSRGEAVEIGGGFRVPEVMAESGARLVDVGTTNRTRLADYQRALDGRRQRRRAHPEGPPVQLPDRGVHRRRRGRRARDARRAGRRRHRIRLARRRVPVARRAARPRGCGASAPHGRPSKPARPPSRSQATSCSAARRPA